MELDRGDRTRFRIAKIAAALSAVPAIIYGTGIADYVDHEAVQNASNLGHIEVEIGKFVISTISDSI
ncbi:MAG TPA: hypothetical protein VK983_04200 [Candidatus Limnocylindrales bacterium]|nr:hypothetical protein [Candidatus Limnocylindrales bacterium]